jgi:uncharacterized coiled-coil protein SlyX
MIEQNPLSTGDVGLDALSASIRRLSEKITLVSDVVEKLSQNRAQLEGKIEGAQKRIQHILSRLPEQSDGRQLNLLGETIPPTNAEDDGEPTTH